MTHLAALPIVIPLLGAAVLAVAGKLVPRRATDLLSIAVALAVCVICLLLAIHTAGRAGPFAYWMGGWKPRHGVAIGIGLSVDPAGAGLAAFAALMVLAALVYSVCFFDAVDGFFQTLMLLFMAGMVAFCLTGDLFNLIVFFELMSVVAYALTAHQIEEQAPIAGALSFAMTNSIGAYAMVIGIGLLYGHTGTLDLTEVGVALSHQGSGGLVAVAFALLLAGLLTKAAVVPLHFWLADAEAVAPTPLCVVISAVMVEIGLYGVARIYWVTFAGALHPHAEAVRVILVSVGTLTALAGAAMCLVQRHIKRLLAFSTISQVGLMLCGVALLQARALGGVGLYLIGHGLTVAALFMCCGVLLHRFRTIDEYDLHGAGRPIPLVGILFALGGLLLSGFPPFTLFAGRQLIERAASGSGFGWLTILFTVVGAVTGGAVLRVGGRVFLGWGPSEGPDPRQARTAEDRIDEARDEHDRTPALMVIVPALLLIAAIVVGLIPGFNTLVQRIGAGFVDGHYPSWILYGRHVPLPHVTTAGPTAAEVVTAVIGVLASGGLAALGLFARPWRKSLPAWVAGPAATGLRRVRQLHSGHIGDYVAWWTAGAGAIGALCVITLR